MNTTSDDLRRVLSEKGLKITPQRVAILNAVYSLENHPTADQVLDHIRATYPNIAVGTVYNVLETLVEHQLIKKVKTVKDVMRYDGVLEKHHHVYCTQCDLIEDYVDEELDSLLKKYFKNKKIEGFIMEDIVLQIRGKFDKC